MPRKTKIDDLDRLLIDLLCINGRMRNSELAARTGLSESAAAARVAWLEGEGIVLGYTAVLGGVALGLADQLTRIRIESEKPAQRLRFEDVVRECDAIISAKRLVGVGDYVLRGAGAGYISEVYKVAQCSGVQIKAISSEAIELEIKPLRGVPLTAFA